jgi:hypothetical protein
MSLVYLNHGGSMRKALFALGLMVLTGTAYAMAVDFRPIGAPGIKGPDVSMQRGIYGRSAAKAPSKARNVESRIAALIADYERMRTIAISS